MPAQPATVTGQEDRSFAALADDQVDRTRGAWREWDGGRLAAVGLAVSAAVLPVASYLTRGPARVPVPACIAGLFAGPWLALPLTRRQRTKHTQP